MNKNILIVAVLLVLVVISAVQAVQLSSLKEKISAGKISTGESSQSVSTAGSNKLSDLPQMVGGC